MAYIENSREERSMKVNLPLIYASLFEEPKYFCMFEDTTIEDDEIFSSISSMKVKITSKKTGGRFGSLSSL